MQKSISVSIGISAYNEEANIKNLLESILQQKEIGFFLKEIIVISDASSDKTAEKVKEKSDKKLRLIEAKTRQGQSLRYNQILKLAKGDIVIFLEADTILKNDSYLQVLIEPFLKDRTVSLTYGSSFPVSVSKGKFFEQMLTFVESLKEKMLRGLDHNALYFCGSGKALARKKYKNFFWPSDVPEDTYIYLYSKQNKLKMVNRQSAVVLFKSPANFWDYAKKSSRFNKGKDQLEKYFPKDFLIDNYRLPKKWFYSFLVKGMSQSPKFMLVYLAFNLMGKVYLRFAPSFNPIWEISKSTKILKK